MIFLLGVINIKSKLLIILMAVVLFVNTYDLTVFANTDYDHDRLLEYEGYAQAMYESVVEQTTFISGRYTANKDYVDKTINTITDYAKGWWNEYERISNMPPKEKIREMLNAGGGYLLTVGDFIKNLFNDIEKDLAPPTSLEPGSPYFTHKSSFMSPGNITINDDYYFKVRYQGFNDTFQRSTIGMSIQNDYHDLVGKYFNLHDVGSDKYLSLSLVSANTHYFDTQEESRREYTRKINLGQSGVSGFIQLLREVGITLDIYQKYTEEPVKFENNLNSPIRTINNYIKQNTPSIVTPTPSAYLSCPDGTRVNMKINGGTFLDVKGNIMQVDKNGTATVDSQICNLGWQKPTIEYIDDRVAITMPNDEVIDAETGETIIPGDGGFDDEIQDGCGTICAIGKLLSGLGSLVKAVAAIPLKILDGLFELMKKIVVPPDNYLTEQMDSIKEEFFNEEIEEGIQSIEELSIAGGGTFESVQVSLMGVDNLMVVDSSSVNKSLDTIHSWIRGIFYPLLLFFNINMLYRLIRGTSLVGIGYYSNKGGGKE